jgi:hypothetical protein
MSEPDFLKLYEDAENRETFTEAERSLAGTLGDDFIRGVRRRAVNQHWVQNTFQNAPSNEVVASPMWGGIMSRASEVALGKRAIDDKEFASLVVGQLTKKKSELEADSQAANKLLSERYATLGKRYSDSEPFPDWAKRVSGSSSKLFSERNRERMSAHLLAKGTEIDNLALSLGPVANDLHSFLAAERGVGKYKGKREYKDYFQFMASLSDKELDVFLGMVTGYAKNYEGGKGEQKGNVQKFGENYSRVIESLASGAKKTLSDYPSFERTKEALAGLADNDFLLHFRAGKIDSAEAARRVLREGRRFVGEQARSLGMVATFNEQGWTREERKEELTKMGYRVPTFKERMLLMQVGNTDVRLYGIHDKLQSLAKGAIDPTPYTAWYDYPVAGAGEVLPYIGLAPLGAVGMTVALTPAVMGDVQTDMEQHGATPKEARNISIAIGPAIAALDAVQAMVATALPGSSKIFDRWKTATWKGLLAKGAARVGTEYAVENVIEGVQDAVQLQARDVWRAIEPDTNLEGVSVADEQEFWGQRLELLGKMSVLALFTAGHSARDYSFLRDVKNWEAFGFSRATASEGVSILQEGLDLAGEASGDKGKELVRDAVKRSQEFFKAAQESGDKSKFDRYSDAAKRRRALLVREADIERREQIARNERGRVERSETGEYIVRAKDGTEIMRTRDAQIAVSAAEAMQDGELVNDASASPPNRLGFIPSKGLTPEQSAREQEFSDQLNSNTDAENDAEYARQPNAFGGYSIGVDTAREMYAPYRENQRENSAATIGVGRTYARDRFRRELARAASENPVIIFSAGGMGSGKSKVVGLIAQARHTVSFDSTMVQPWHMQQVADTLASGRKAHIIYVHTSVENAMRRSDNRSTIEGRYVSPEELGSAHYKVQRNVLALADKYKDNPNVTFEVWDNNGAAGEHKKVEKGVAFLQEDGNLYSDENSTIDRARKVARPPDGFSGVAKGDGASSGGSIARGDARGGTAHDRSVPETGKTNTGNNRDVHSGPTAQASSRSRLATGRPHNGMRKGAIGTELLNKVARFLATPRENRSLGFRRAWIDSASVVADVSKMAQEASLLEYSEDANPFLLLSRFRRSADSVVSQMLKEGMVNMHGERTGGASLSAAFEGLDDAQRKEFVAYLGLMQTLSQRFRELHGVVAEDGTYQGAAAYLAGLSFQNATADFETRASIVFEWNQGVLAYAGMDGLVSDWVDTGETETVTRSRDLAVANPIPRTYEVIHEEILTASRTFRVPLWDFDFSESEPGKRIGHRLKGSNKPIYDPHDSMVTQATMLVLRARLQTALGAQNAAGLGPLFAEKTLAAMPEAESQAILDEVRDAVVTMVNDGMIDADGVVVGPSLNSAFEGLNEARRAAFVRYLHARRTLALDSDGKGRHSGMTSEEAAAIVARETGGFAARAEIVYQWNTGLLEFMRGSDASATPHGASFFGEDVDRIQGADPGDYIPLWRSASAYERMSDIQVPLGKSAGERTETVEETETRETRETREEIDVEWIKRVITWEETRNVRAIEGFQKDISGEFSDAESFVKRQIAVAKSFVVNAQKRAVLNALFDMADELPGVLTDYMTEVIDTSVFDTRDGRGRVKNPFTRASRTGKRKAEAATGGNETDGAEGTPHAWTNADGALVAFMTPVFASEDGANVYVADYTDGRGLRFFQVDKGLYEAVASMNQNFPTFGKGAIAESWRDWGDTHGRGAAFVAAAAIGAIDVIERGLRLSASFFRAAATAWNPRFGLGTNVVRDLETLTYNTRTGAVPVRVWENWMSAMFSASIEAVSGGHIGGTATHTAYKALFDQLGLQLSGSLKQDSLPLAVAVDEVLGKRNFKTVAHGSWSYLTSLLQFPETAARIAEMRTVAEQMGWDIETDPMTPEIAVKLALAAKQVTVDFTRAGEIAGRWNTIVPFFNSAIQGKVSAYEAFKRNPAQWLMTRGLTVAVLAALNWYRNKDEEWWQQMPTGQRLPYTYVKGWKRADGTHEVFQIPRAFEVDMLFAGLTTSILDGCWGSGPEGKQQIVEWFKGAFEEMSVVGSLDGLGAMPESVAGRGPVGRGLYRAGTSVNHDALPPLLREVWAQAHNEDRFWKSQIVSGPQLELRPDEQFGAYTTKLAISLGKIFGLSPRRIDHAIKAQGAGMVGWAAGLGGRGGADDAPDGGRAAVEGESADALFGMGAALFRRGGDAVNPHSSVEVRRFYETAGKFFRELDANSHQTAADYYESLAMGSAMRAIMVVTRMHDAEPDRGIRKKLALEVLRLARDAQNDFDGHNMGHYLHHWVTEKRKREATAVQSGVEIPPPRDRH